MLRILLLLLICAATPVAALSMPGAPRPGAGVYIQEVPSGIQAPSPPRR